MGWPPYRWVFLPPWCLLWVCIQQPGEVAKGVPELRPREELLAEWGHVG